MTGEKTQLRRPNICHMLSSEVQRHKKYAKKWSKEVFHRSSKNSAGADGIPGRTTSPEWEWVLTGGGLSTSRGRYEIES